MGSRERLIPFVSRGRGHGGSGARRDRGGLGAGLLIHFDAVTLFPEMFDAVTRSGMTRRAFEGGVYELVLWNPRDFSTNAYRSVDDRPYGGGPGMVMMPEPLERALRAARQRQTQLRGEGPEGGLLHAPGQGAGPSGRSPRCRRTKA